MTNFIIYSFLITNFQGESKPNYGVLKAFNK